jgi:two-component system, chemotaxis family, protein-glutamate methylesterase/glutaminase
MSTPASRGSGSTEDIRVKILVVDDSAFMRKAITQMISSEPGFEVIGTAVNGQDGIEKALRLRPDVITMDIEMPVLDGITALKKIRADAMEPKPAILVCSSLTVEGSHEALRAMRMGAADVIAKPASHFSLDINDIQQDLIAKLKAIAETRGYLRQRATGAVAPVPSLQHAGKSHAAPLPTSIDLRGKRFDAVLIGSSTGGPPVLESLICGLMESFPVPVVVAQHMPALFTKSLSERLAQSATVNVLHGDQTSHLEPGTVTIIVGGRHGRVVKDRAGGLALEISPDPAAALYKPSVNELFTSGASTLGPKCLSVVLTGMGDDGMLGGREIRRNGGMVLAQEASSCVVYGMPRAVAENGIAAAALTPDNIRATLNRWAESAGSSNFSGTFPHQNHPVERRL